jgi:hypothetical protein
MTSKKSRTLADSGQGKDALANDTSRRTGPEDQLLFPIAPDTRAPLAGEEPEPEELLLPSHDEAKALCNLAAQIKALAPWQWMEETDVFGVEDPDTGEIGFVSIMGNVGEYEAVAVYPGAEGLYGFIDFQTDPSPSQDRLLETPQVQVSFSEPKFLEKRDRELLKGAAIKFTGTKPLFRSYRPGFLPWFITLKEARLLIHTLSQTLEMTRRFAAGSVNFPDDGDNGDRNGDGETELFLVRVSHQEETAPSGRPPAFRIVWEDQIKRIPRPKPPRLEISIDASLLADLKGFDLSAMQLEADLFIGPGRIGKPQDRPLALYMLMLADRLSGIIFGFEALAAEASLNAMYASVPEVIARLLWENKVLPKQIIVRSVLLLELLEPLGKELKIQLRCANKLPSLDKAVRSMTKWLATGKM